MNDNTFEMLAIWSRRYLDKNMRSADIVTDDSLPEGSLLIDENKGEVRMPRSTRAELERWLDRQPPSWAAL